jgi:sec-independent protein translocase protein TatA
VGGIDQLCADADCAAIVHKRATLPHVIGDILQPSHLLFILVIALIVLGPKKLPEAGRSLGRGLRDFRSALSGADPREDLAQLGQLTAAPNEQAAQPAATTETPTAQAATPPAPEQLPKQPEPATVSGTPPASGPAEHSD